MFKKVCLIACLATFVSTAFAQSTSKPEEKKVDYLEKIYFSGGTKDSLYVSILKTVQSLDNKPATYAVAKQYLFLSDIEDAVQHADNACDVEGMLGAGIYKIDANEAQIQGIPVPNNKSASDAANAVNSIAAFGNSTQNLAYSAWVLSPNRMTPYGYCDCYGYSPAESSIYTTGYKLSAVANTAGSAIDMVQEGKAAMKFLHLNKDKACKTVSVKPIDIGEHDAPDTNSTAIIINNITAEQLPIIAAAIGKIPGIGTVNSDNFNNNIATLLIAAHNMDIQELVSRIKQSNKGYRFDTNNTSTKGAMLTLK